MKTLYVSDLDGTLLNSKAEIPPKTSEILNQLTADGMYFTFATARSIYSALPITDVLDISVPCILMNGVSIYDKKQQCYVRNVTIPCSASERIIRTFQDMGEHCFMYKFIDGVLTCCYTEITDRVMKSFAEVRKKRYNKPFLQCRTFLDEADDNVVYFTVTGSYDRLKAVADRLSDVEGASHAFYEDSYSHNWYLEFFSAEASKDNAVRYLKENYGFDKVVAFGDNYNDISMLKFADTAVVVENAPDSVKEIADFVIGTNECSGVAEYLMKMNENN